MNKSIFAIAAMLPTVASAQGLFDIAPNDEAIDSVQLSYTAGARIGWDSNISPGSGTDTSSTFSSVYIGANAVSVSSRSTLEFYGRYTANFHDKTATGSDSFSNNMNVGLNYSLRINERVRFSSRNHIGYELEPDYNYGFANTRAIDEYLYWSSDNSIGYRFSNKLASYFGLSITGVNYGADNSAGDRKTFTPYVQGRYQLSPRTVLTAGYRYNIGDNATGRDSTSHILTVGAEHRLSPTAVFVVRAGAQIHDIDGGGSSTSPYLEAAYRTSISERTKLRTFVRYGISDYDTSFPGGSYDVNQNLRFGFAATHQMSERLVFNTGVSYIFSDFQDSPNALPDETASLLNAYVGLNYRVSESMYLDATVNQTWASSDIATRDYDRTRASVGLSYSF